jgi:hypothetical protein
VIGQGSSANVGLGAGGEGFVLLPPKCWSFDGFFFFWFFLVAIPMSYSAPPMNHPPHFDPSYAHLQANTNAMASSSLGQGPSMPNGMFNHSTGHIPPFSPPSPQQHQFPNGYSPQPQPAYSTHPAYNQSPPPSPQPVYNQNPPPPQPVYYHQPAPTYPTHQSQTSVQSAPLPVSAPLIQVTQTTHQRNPSHTSVASQPPHMVPLPPSQPSSPPLADRHATAQSNAFLGATAPMSSPSASSSTGSISGTTLVQSPQPTTTQPVFPSPTSTAVTAATPTLTSTSLPVPAPTAIEASASSASAPAATSGQAEQPALPEFPELKLRPGATIVSLNDDEGQKKKKKKKTIFSRMFKKSSKGTTLAANA